ncbi:MAG: sulfatase-like hydrolase/transferase [Lachnospiraceae bacterium]|nr:sulfatase-like hydrolase/transferase [Lachnospiraceae bacterium]
MKDFARQFLPDNKIKTAFGAALAFIMLAAMLIFGVDGTKHMILGAGLCIGSGYLISMRKWDIRLSFAVFLLYLIFVPQKLFYRIELPVNTMEFLRHNAMIVAVLTIYVLYLFFFVVFQRINLSLGITSLFLMIFTAAEFYVFTFRGQAISFSDLFAVRTALMVSGEYDYHPSGELVYSLLWFVFFACLGFKINLSPKTVKEVIEDYKPVPVHVAGSIIATAIVIIFFGAMLKTPVLLKFGINDEEWAEHNLCHLNSCLLYPFVEYRVGRIDKPRDYSEEQVIETGRQYAESYVSENCGATIRPNIILIMNEALSDPRVLGDFEVNEPYMPYLDSLFEKEGAIRGNLYMPVLGGLTVNSEFEALTGNTCFFLSSSSIPYETLIKKQMHSLASELKECGYYAMAMHPNSRVAYSRDKVYNLFGFDEFVDVNDFETPIEIGADNYITDACNYKEMIARFEKRDKDKPLFLFDVTIQNHGPYWNKGRSTRVTRVNGTSGEFDNLYCLEETYLDSIRESDKAFKELVEYFESVDEPTIICMFGDHQAILSDQFYEAIYAGRELSETEKKQLKYKVPYVMVANYDAGLENYGSFSANYLGAVLLEELGLPMSDFREFQLQAMKEYPVMSAWQFSGAGFISLDKKEHSDDTIIADYRMFQYDSMFSGKETQSVHVP